MNCLSVSLKVQTHLCTYNYWFCLNFLSFDLHAYTSWSFINCLSLGPIYFPSYYENTQKNNLMPLQLVLNPKLYIPTSTLNIELVFWHTQWIAMLNHGLNHQFKSNLPETSQVQLLGWAASFNCLQYVHHYNPRLLYLLPHFWSPFHCFQGGFFRKFCPYVWLVF